jgi:hypothetical protein
MARRARRTRQGRGRRAEPPDFVALVRAWGGVTLAYRKRMQDSPAYRLNHEEVVKALEEGIVFAENLDPVEAVADAFGHVQAMAFTRHTRGGRHRARGASGANRARRGRHGAERHLRARASGLLRSSMAAAGSSRAFRLRTRRRDVPARARRERVLHVARRGGRFVTYYGDNHPRYNGNVVKAMASAKHGYPHVVAALRRRDRRARSGGAAARDAEWHALVGRLDAQLLATVERVERLTPTIIEVVVKAPAAARHFHPGPVLPAAELRAPQPAREHRRRHRVAHDGGHRAHGRLGRQGTRAALAHHARDGRVEPAVRLPQARRAVVVMGPTGTPTEIPENETVLLAGGGLGNAVLFSISHALKRRATA